MDKGNFCMKIKVYIMVNGKIIKEMDSENLLIKKILNMWDNG